MTPNPPSRAMAMAMSLSVTASMLALTMGTAISMWRENRDRVSTCAREVTSDRWGTSKTSSNVRPSRMGGVCMSL
jgi:hypothetical protein